MSDEKKIATVSTPFGSSSFFEEAWAKQAETITKDIEARLLEQAVDHPSIDQVQVDEVRRRTHARIEALFIANDMNPNTIVFGPFAHHKRTSAPFIVKLDDIDPPRKK